MTGDAAGRGGRGPVGAQLAAAAARVVDVLALLRWPLLLVMACGLTAAGLLLNPGTMTDLRLFLRYSQPLLAGHWSGVYAEAGNQGGPLELTWIGVCGRVGRLVSVPAYVSAGVLTAAAVVAALMVAASGWAAGASAPGRRRVELAVGVVAAVTLAPWAAGWGHPSEIAIPLLWLSAVRQAHRGRWLMAGLLLGAAAGWESWAVLGVPLLLAAGLRRSVPAAAVAVVSGVAWYAPFAAPGHFAMFSQQWSVTGGTLPWLLGVHEVPWTLRLAQAVLVVAATAVVVWCTRGSRHQLWLPVFTLVTVRVLTDPLPWPYYWCLPLLPAVAGAVLVVRSGASWCRRAWMVAAVLLLAGPHPDPPWGYPQLLLAAAAIVAAVLPTKRSHA